MVGFLHILNKRAKKAAGARGDGLLLRKTASASSPKRREVRRAQTTIVLSAREPSPEGLLAELIGLREGGAGRAQRSSITRDSLSTPSWMDSNNSRATQLNAIVPLARRILQQLNSSGTSGRELELLVKRAVSMAVHELSGTLSITSKDSLEAARELLTFVRGKGPLQPLFDDPLVTDVYIDDWNKVRCKRQGKSVDTPCIFRAPSDYEAFCCSLLEPANERLTPSKPRVDIVLNDEWRSRVNMVHGSLRGEGHPGIAIRIPRLQSATMYDLLKSQTLPAPIAAWLSEFMTFGEQSALIIGPTGSGKTTVATALLNSIGSDERVLLLEHLPEIRPASCHIERLRIDHPWSEQHHGLGVAEVVDIVRARGPHRIVWGEVRERDRASFVELLADGYAGSLATMCGDDAYEAVHRLARGVEGSFNLASLATTVSRTIGLVIRLHSLNGKPCLYELAEVVPSDGPSPALRTLLRYEGEAHGKRIWRMLASSGGVIDLMASRGVEILCGPSLLPAEETAAGLGKPDGAAV